MQVFSDTLGLISILAKGIRKSKPQSVYLLNILNEYELVVTEPTQSGLHTLTELTLIREYPTDLPLNTWFNVQAGAEILTKLLIPHDEVPQFYLALSQYLDYQKQVQVNSIAIFWRYLLHLYKLMGIPVNLSLCSLCHKELIKPAGYSAQSGRLLCQDCLPISPEANMFTAEAISLISMLPTIGNFIKDLEISKQSEMQINDFLLSYLSLQFNKPIHLKCLQNVVHNKKGLSE